MISEARKGGGCGKRVYGVRSREKGAQGSRKKERNGEEGGNVARRNLGLASRVMQAGEQGWAGRARARKRKERHETRERANWEMGGNKKRGGTVIGGRRENKAEERQNRDRRAKKDKKTGGKKDRRKTKKRQTMPS